MKEIVERLHENRQLEKAKSILESNGYKVSKKSKRLKESYEEAEWDPFKGSKYRVAGGDYHSNVYTDDPREAIEAWFKYGQETPTEAYIMSKTKADAVEINRAATEDFLTPLYSKYKCPYKLDYLIKDSKRKLEDGQRGFYEGKYGYGDQVHPFGVG